MKKMNLLISIILTFFLAACAGNENTRSTGQTLDDAAITARVKNAIAVSQGLRDAASINVDTYRGVVSLAGFVNNAQEARAAGLAASRVNGVDRVVNNLQLKSSTPSTGE